MRQCRLSADDSQGRARGAKDATLARRDSPKTRIFGGSRSCQRPKMAIFGVFAVKSAENPCKSRVSRLGDLHFRVFRCGFFTPGVEKTWPQLKPPHSAKANRTPSA